MFEYVVLALWFLMSLFWFAWAATANFIFFRKEKRREEKIAYPARVIIVVDLMVANLALFWFCVTAENTFGGFEGTELLFFISVLMYLVLSIFCIAFFTRRKHKMIAVVSLLIMLLSLLAAPP
jgi:hypothetical protein